jgi:hypothetical protein
LTSGSVALLASLLLIESDLLQLGGLMYGRAKRLAILPYTLCSLPAILPVS